jgi:prepilin-type processing-associated H-X9-DG protein
MKQLGTAMALWGTDHLETLLPACFRTGDYQYQLTWDDYIHRYIGGTDADEDLILGITAADKVPKVLKCPADRIEVSISWGPYGSRRSYSMNFAGIWDKDAQGSIPPARFGTGIYIKHNDASIPPWEPPGYKSGTVQDNTGTILLAEVPNGENMAGNDWPSFCAGPYYSTANFNWLTPDCFQLGSSTFNYGAASYGLHARRFNYLFHDGHTQTLKVTDTVGTGTTNAPRGMWTLLAGD